MKTILVLLGIVIIVAAGMKVMRRNASPSPEEYEGSAQTETQAKPSPANATPAPARTTSTPPAATPKVQGILRNSKLRGSSLDEPAKRGSR